jgi:hypothetical protein
MFTYHTPDGRRWLYGGGAPVGITSGLAHRLDRAGVAHLGAIGWDEHSQLWAGVTTGKMVEAAILAIVRALIDAAPDAAPITADDVAAALKRLLTHPG